MSVMASQITSLMIVYSIVYSGAGQIKHQSSAFLAFFCGEFTGHQWIRTMASNAEMLPIDCVIKMGALWFAPANQNTPNTKAGTWQFDEV